MISVKRKKKLRYLLFWESEGELINNHRLKRWLLTKNAIIIYSENMLYTGEAGWICMECEKLYGLYERKIKTGFILCA